MAKSLDIKYEAMEGPNREARRLMELGEAGAMHEAGIVSDEQKVEHYENASYERLRRFAELIGIIEVGSVVKDRSIENKAADENLSEDTQQIF